MNNPHDVHSYDELNYIITETSGGNVYFFKKDVPYQFVFLDKQKAKWKIFKSKTKIFDKSVVTVERVITDISILEVLVQMKF